MSPSSARLGPALHPDRGLGLGFVLGTEYEIKKKKLQKELQQDYKLYTSQKKDWERKQHNFSHDAGLSLPIDDNISVREKLREERKKEYNLSLVNESLSRRIRRGASAAVPLPSGAGVSDIVNMPSASARRGPALHPDRGLGSMLGTEYEKKKKQQLATGLMIGVSEEEKKLVAELRKEKYKAELLKQIAEKQRNKVGAKTLERMVDTTGATDLQKEEMNDVLLDHSSENHNGDFSQELGDTTVPRAAGLDPLVCPLCYTPLHPSLPYYGTPACAPPPNFGTPAYAPPPHNGTPAYAPPPHNGTPAYAPPPHNGTPAYAPPPHYGIQVYPLNPHYGTRNPLEPTLPYKNAPSREPYQSGRKIDQRSSAAIEVSHQSKATHFQCEELAENSGQQRESEQSYNEVLRQQMKEKEMEKREAERYNAKIEAESGAYNPWGRGGGGAPMKDKQGNLHCDLRRMHTLNEERILNPTTTRAGAQVPVSHPPSALTDKPRSEQVDMKTKLQQELMQQMKEKRRQKVEEREREMREEEKLEKKLEKQRALDLKQFEEEQKQRMMKVNRVKNQHEVRQHEPQRKEMRKQVRPIVIVPQKTQEEHSQRKHERDHPPAIPTLRKKHGKDFSPSAHSSRTEHTVSAPTGRPHPERIPQLQSHQQDVIRKLSDLRGYLRKEEKQLEVQVHQTQTIPDYIGSHRQSRADNFRSAPNEAHWTLVYRNISEFDQLKHREYVHDQRHQRNPSGQRENILESDSTFIRNNYEENDHHHHQRSSAPQSRSTRAKWTHFSDQRKHESELQQRNMRRNIQPRNHSSTTERLPDNEDNLSLSSALERCVSTETVATEAWMRPGTSDAVKLC